MADPGRPVTGYPVSTSINGYSTNPPPMGVSYPYGAPPPAGGYYSYQNYSLNSQYDPFQARRRVLLRRVFALAIGGVLIFGTVTFIMSVIFRPQLPEFQVDSFAISNFTLGNTSLVSFASTIRLTAMNPNKKLRLDYDDIQAALCYESSTLSQTNVAPFSQENRNATSLTTNFAASESSVDGSAINRIKSDRLSDGNVNFNLRMVSAVSFSSRTWRTRTRLVRVVCLNLIVGLPNNVSYGTLTAGPKPCRVGI